jgi:hypothetical protein
MHRVDSLSACSIFHSQAMLGLDEEPEPEISIPPPPTLPGLADETHYSIPMRRRWVSRRREAIDLGSKMDCQLSLRNRILIGNPPSA